MPEIVATSPPKPHEPWHIRAVRTRLIDPTVFQEYKPPQIVIVDKHRAKRAGSQQTHGRSQSVNNGYT